MVRQSAEVRALAREISALKQAQRDGSLTPQLGRSSLDDESINTYDSDGNLRARYGLQHDGTYTAAVLDGPVPPVPTVPTVEGGAGELTVAWDGTYEDDQRAPMDFHVVEVWAADDDFSDRSEARLLGHFANESGGDITVARPVGEWHIALVSKAQSGRRSAVSERAIAEVTSVVDQDVIDELEEKLENLPSVTWSEDAPTAADGDGKPVDAVWRRVDPATDAVIGEWTWDGSQWIERGIADDVIYSLDVGKLFASELGVDTAVANEIWAEKIAASKIDAEEINTQTLGADAGFIGVLNSAEIVGAVIKTAASGARVELDSGHGIRIFNTAGELVLSADSDGNLISGDENSHHVSINPDGMRLIAQEPIQPIAETQVLRDVDELVVANDRIYTSGFNSNYVTIYDLSGNMLSQWSLTAGYFVTLAASGSHILTTSAVEGAFGIRTPFHQIRNLSGTVLHTWPTGSGHRYTHAAILGNEVFACLHNKGASSHTIDVRALSGNIKRTWNVPGIVNGLAAASSRVYVATNEGVRVYNTTGTLQSLWEIESGAQNVHTAGGFVYVHQGTQLVEYGTDGNQQRIVSNGLAGKSPAAVAPYEQKVYAGAGKKITAQDFPSPTSPTEKHVNASLSTQTGRMTARDAVLTGATIANSIFSNRISPIDASAGGAYSMLELLKPAFPLGANLFTDPGHRDEILAGAPDGTTAWTGQGSTLTLWLMTDGQWTKLDHTPPYEVASGVVTMNGTGTKTVTFPAGVFSGAPTVVVSPASGEPAPEMAVRGYNADETSFTIRYQRASDWRAEHTGDRDVAWIAWRAK